MKGLFVSSIATNFLPLKKIKLLQFKLRNILILALEMYKIKHNISPSLMQDTFHERNATYKLRSQWTFNFLELTLFTMEQNQ